MDAKIEQPKKKKKMKKKKTNPKSPSFSSLPDDIVVNCLARVSKSYYLQLSLVCKSFRSLLSSPELYTVRSQIGNTELCLYIRRELVTCDAWYTLDQTLNTKGGKIKDEFSLVPVIPPSSTKSPAPLQSTTLAVGYEIYQIGGTFKSKLSKAVRVLDCRNHTWRDAPNMLAARKRAKCFCVEGKIYVMGGCSRTEQWAEVFDVKTQTWKPLLSPSDDGFDREYKVGVFGGKLYVMKNSKNYAYDSEEGRWKELLLEDCLGTEPMDGPCCIIENVKFTYDFHRVKWYDSERRKWIIVQGIDFGTVNAVELADYGGKLIILWNRKISMEPKFRSRNKNIYCAVIRLEKRIGLFGLEIWGKIERLNYLLSVDSSYNVVLRCIML